MVGGPVPEALAESLRAAFPRARVVSLYGLTEGGAALCLRVMDSNHHQSIGRPAPGTEIRILDEAGNEVPVGEVGEIVIRTGVGSPMPSYVDGKLNEVWFTDGWARTGDLGLRTSEGDIRLFGRAKELIFLRAGRIAPETVEEILSRVIPPSIEFAVVGVTSEKAWDLIAVVLKRNADEAELARAVRNLEEFRGPFHPKLVQIVDDIPRGPFGKPLRRVLAQKLAAADH